jgi:hypothetical protein
MRGVRPRYFVQNGQLAPQHQRPRNRPAFVLAHTHISPWYMDHKYLCHPEPLLNARNLLAGTEQTNLNNREALQFGRRRPKDKRTDFAVRAKLNICPPPNPFVKVGASSRENCKIEATQAGEQFANGGSVIGCSTCIIESRWQDPLRSNIAMHTSAQSEFLLVALVLGCAPCDLGR